MWLNGKLLFGLPNYVLLILLLVVAAAYPLSKGFFGDEKGEEK